MRIYDADITGSLTYNSQTITSFGTVDAVSSSVVDLTNASGSFSTRVTSVESSISNLDNTYATDVEVSTAVSGLNAATSSYLKNTTDTLDGDLTVTGIITAQEFHTEFVSASIIYKSGSTKFGDSKDDIHEFTGSVRMHNISGPTSGSFLFTGGQVTISGDDADLNLDITSGSSIANLSEIRFRVDGGTMGRLYMHKGNKNMYLGPTYFLTSSLFIQDGTGTVMTVTGSKVGIGTVEPQAELDVRTSSQQAIYAYTDGGYNALEFSSDGGITTGSLLAYNNTVRLGNASTVGGFSNGIIIDSNGNVGIGTDSPGTRLHVQNTASNIALFERTGGQWAKVQIKAGTDTGNSYLEFFDQTGIAGSLNYEHANDSLIFNVSSSNAMVIYHDGRIGIDGYSNGAYLSSIGSFRIDIDSNSDQTDRAFIISKDAAGTELLRVQEDGYVGIGTTSPAQQLEILYPSYIDKDTVQGLLRLTGQSNTENGAGIPSAGVGIEFYNKWSGGSAYSMGRISARGEQSYNGGLQFDVSDNTAPGQNNFTTAMSIDAEARIGIGTTSPQQKLTVDGTSSGAYIRISNAASGDISSGFMIYNGNNLDTQIYTNPTFGNTTLLSREAWAIRAGGSQRMAILSDGNVGINSTGPAYKLDVVGNARFTEQLKVEQPIVTWSDSGTKHYTHLATFSGYGSSASALIINTNIPGHNQSGNGNMFTFRIVGYAYGNFGLIDMLVGCYAGENNYYSAWWTGTCQTNWVDNVYVYTNSSGKVAFQIGETTDTLAAEIAITDFVQGFGNVSTSYADSWSCQAVTTLPTQTNKVTLGYKAVAPDIYEDVTFHNNVGIGDTTSIGSMTSGGGLLTIGRNGSLGTDDVVGALSFHTNDASFTAYHADGISAQISAHSDNPNGASGRLSFYTAYGGSRGERMRITSNGDVGIGATSPYNYSGYKSLTIGNGSSTGLIKFGTGADANGPEIFSSTSTGGLIFNASSTGTRFRYYSNAGEYSFSTNGPSTGNGVAFYAEHTTQSTGFHYYFRFLESQTNASAAGIKAGGILASATYSVANPDRGDIYAQDNISALSFTDRTPYPSSLEVAKAVVNSHQRRTDAEIEELVTAAYNRIQSQIDDMPQPEKEALTLEQYKAKYSKEYELDHNVLHDYVNDTKYANQGIEARDLSATVSCLVEVVKDLMQRIDTLEGN